MNGHMEGVHYQAFQRWLFDYLMHQCQICCTEVKKIIKSESTREMLSSCTSKIEDFKGTGGSYFRAIIEFYVGMELA